MMAIDDDSNKEINNKYELVRKILSNFAIDLCIKDSQYVIKPNEKIYEVIFCIISNNKDQYGDDFVKGIVKFDKYKPYLKQA